MKNIIITVPQNIRWENYIEELVAVADGSADLNFRIPSIPLESGAGAKCFVCYRGLVRGYMLIKDIVKRDGFQCTTTGVLWPAGNYLIRTGKFFPLFDVVQCKGFQGWHYTTLD